MRIRHVILDFDGSCTRVQDAAAAYLEAYQRLFATHVGADVAAHWNEALATVRARSPRAGWMLGGTPSAPAAADPYILAGEAALWVVRTHDIQMALPSDLHSKAYEAAPAPFRPELLEVLEGLVALDLHVCFVSNSSTKAIERRLDELLPGSAALRRRLVVVGDAAKFRIRELSDDGFETDPELRHAFEALPAAADVEGLGRPIYLRRGAYFEALCTVWRNDASAPARSIACGDIWELDLALPAAVGMHVHLVTRASPYDTYDYELAEAERLGPRGGVSTDLRGLLARVSLDRDVGEVR